MLSFVESGSRLSSEACDRDEGTGSVSGSPKASDGSVDGIPGSGLGMAESRSLLALTWLSPLIDSSLGLVPGRTESWLEDVREDADVMLVCLAEPFIAPAIDGLGGRTLLERAVGGPMDGRAARRPGTDGFWTWDEVML